MILTWISLLDQLFASSYTRATDFSPLHFILFDLLALIVVYKVLCLFSKNEPKLGYLKTNKETLAGIKKLFQDINSAGQLTGQGKILVTGTVGKEVDKLLETVKQVQEMHSSFQTEVIESHINILKILAPGDSNFLMPPERELVEPDSALPPLDEDEEVVDFI